MNNILIFGGGQIGTAVKQILKSLCRSQDKQIPKTIADTLHSYYIEDNAFEDCNVLLCDMIASDRSDFTMDINASSPKQIFEELKRRSITHVINALPFSLNEKIARAAVAAECHYIDFTEDDQMAEKVQALYASSSKTCAVKCGLAPGFINYVGHSLVKKIDFPDKLMISVGALPRTASFKPDDPGSNYNLSWSVDGLVNEYIRPCSVKMKGKELSIPALTGLETILIDGVQYEAAFTSGGIGSLVKELKRVPNVYYKTLRYPGHYSYVIDAVKRHNSQFEPIKKEFLDKFPFNSDDIIVVFAECVGNVRGKGLRREVFSAKFKGTNGLSAIQSTTAGGGLAILELMLKGVVSGMVNHSNIPLGSFMNTEIYKRTYLQS